MITYKTLHARDVIEELNMERKEGESIPDRNVDCVQGFEEYVQLERRRKNNYMKTLSDEGNCL